MNRHKTPLRAWIGGAFTVGALILAGLLAHEGILIQREFAEWEVARPVRMAVDLSVAGVYRGPLHQTCQISHGEELGLHVSPAFESTEAAKAALHGLEGSVRILRTNGEEEYSEALNLEQWPESWAPAEDVVLARFVPFRRGDYVCELKIDKPASGMAGRGQEIVGWYRLCGCELMGASVAFLICGVLAVAGLVVGGVSYRCVWKAKRAAVAMAGLNAGNSGQSLPHP